jgi:hypothetical protein
MGHLSIHAAGSRLGDRRCARARRPLRAVTLGVAVAGAAVGRGEPFDVEQAEGPSSKQTTVVFQPVQR